MLHFRRVSYFLILFFDFDFAISMCYCIILEGNSTLGIFDKCYYLTPTWHHRYWYMWLH